MAEYNQFVYKDLTAYGYTGDEQTRKLVAEIKSRLDVLYNNAKLAEMAKAEQASRHAEALRNLTQRANDRSLEGKAKRYLERYRKKLKRSQEAGDLAAASLMDQRIRTIEALLEL
ncbi:hypothetical protein [Nonomuraea rosea]|uniref:hypothetical protein n=1 Tax=Nonomuraea rosea TaxID=638574 RepID=UPI0031F1AA4D